MTYRLVNTTAVITTAAAAKHDLINKHFDYDKVYCCYDFAAEALSAIDNAIATALPIDIRYAFERSRNHLQLLLNEIIEVLAEVKKFTRQKMDNDSKLHHLSMLFNNLMCVVQEVLPITAAPPQDSITY